jgi:hypothetical protein
MKEIDFKYFKSLGFAEMSFSKLPDAITKSSAFNNLIEANILAITKMGRGKIIRVINKDAYDKFMATHFPDQMEGDSRAINISRFRNSKAIKRSSANICFLRGKEAIEVNNKTIKLAEYTNDFGLFSAYNPQFKVQNLCIVENLETFLNAEKLFGDAYTFLHKYGRIGTEFLQKISASSIVVFSDYDLVGLNEYLKIKTTFPKASFYFPEDFDTLFRKYSTVLPEKQVASNAVKQSRDPIIVKVREMVFKSNRYLEQEILLLNK